MKARRESSTHDELVKRACRWLTGRQRCSPVFAEFQHLYSDEMPDAIGWTRKLTHVVEVKVSRADFAKDAMKRHVRAGDSIGNRRWYLTPIGLIQPEEIPEGYGLLYAKPRGLSIIRKAMDRTPSPKAIREELDILRQAVRRHVKRVAWHPNLYCFFGEPLPKDVAADPLNAAPEAPK